MFGQDDPLPSLTHPIFSSDFGNSDDPAGLVLGAHARWLVATLLGAMQTHAHALKDILANWCKN